MRLHINCEKFIIKALSNSRRFGWCVRSLNIKGLTELE